MSYARQTLTLHSVAPDLIPQDAPLESWTSGMNVRFHNGETLAAREDAATLLPHRVALTIVYVEPFDTGYWVYANATGVWAHDGTTEYNITPTVWTGHGPTTVWTSCVINGLAVINTSTGDPVWWDGNPANIMTPLPDWPSGGRCVAMRAHKGFLFAVGMLSEGGQRVRWSDAAEAGEIPQEWTPSASNFAGFVDLAPMSSECVDAMTLGDDMVIYKRESIWAATMVLGNAVFAFRQMFTERGAAATNGVCRGPDDEHLFIGSDGDIWVTDGVQMRSVLDGRAQRFFYDDFSRPTNGVYSASTLMREKLGIICYPSGGATNGTRALLFDFASGDIGFRDLPGVHCMAAGRALKDVGDSNTWTGDDAAWGIDTEVWNQRISSATVEDVVYSGEDGEFLFEGGDLALTVNIEKHGIAFGNPKRRKIVSRIWPKISGRDGDVVKIRLGGQDVTGGPTDLSPPVDFVIGSDQPVDAFVSGRFITLIVESDDTVAPWRMGTVDVEYREVGGW